MKKLTIYAVLLTMLAGCSSLETLFTQPRVVTQFEIQKVDVPSEFLTPAVPPSAQMLSGVKVCAGADKLSQYGKELLYCNHLNTEKIKAISELLQ